MTVTPPVSPKTEPPKRLSFKLRAVDFERMEAEALQLGWSFWTLVRHRLLKNRKGVRVPLWPSIDIVRMGEANGLLFILMGDLKKLTLTFFDISRTSLRKEDNATKLDTALQALDHLGTKILSTLDLIELAIRKRTINHPKS